MAFHFVIQFGRGLDPDQKQSIWKAFVVFKHVRPWKLMLKCQWRGNSRWAPAVRVHVAIVPCNSWQHRRASQLKFTQSQHGDNNRRICASLTRGAAAYPVSAWFLPFPFRIYPFLGKLETLATLHAIKMHGGQLILLYELLIFSPTL